jgi:hypothetical protein
LGECQPFVANLGKSELALIDPEQVPLVVLLGKGGVDGGQHLVAQAMRFKQVPKPQDGGLIGQTRGAWVKASEIAIHTDVMQRFFRSDVEIRRWRG